MARTSGIVRAADEYPGRVGVLYTITPELRLLFPGGAVSLTFFIGSRRMGRSYAFSEDGLLYQAPVGYYATRREWDLAPGYEKDRRPDLTRPIGADCLFCHTTSAVLEPGKLNRYPSITHGIACARCHGDPVSHEKIVQPAKLAPRLRDSVCEQCHLAGAVRLARPGKRFADFRPGEDWATYAEVFVGDRGKAEVRVNGHSEALAESRCKQAAGDRLWCGTCHSPHRAIDYVAVCQSCHAQPHSRKDCIACHMPKSRAADGGHTVFTDHSIARRKTKVELHSFFGRVPSSRDLGLAYVELATRRKDSALLEKAWPLLRGAAGTGDPAVHRAIAGLLEADGRSEQAVEHYRLSLRYDPTQPDVLRRLSALLGSSEESQGFREQADRILPVPRAAGANPVR